MPQPAAGNDHRHDVGPMVPPGVFVDDRRSTKLTHHQNESLIQQSALFEVSNETVERAIDSWNKRLEPFLDAAPANAVAVVVEVAPRSADQYERDSGFNQPSREQRFLTDAFPTVQVASGVCFALQVERFLDLAGNDHLVRLLCRTIKRSQRAVLIDVLPQSIELHPQRVPVL